MLSASGIYLLDFHSEAFVWIGKLVPKSQQTKAIELANKVIS